MQINTFDWKKMKPAQKLHQFLYKVGFGPVIGCIILLLTTTGRKSGLKRVTPLQYERIEEKYVLGAARGLQADWVRNIQASPQVEVRVKNLQFYGSAEVVTDPVRIADFLEERLRRRPFMMGLLMQKAHHLPKRPSRQQLEQLAQSEVIVVVTPERNL